MSAQPPPPPVAVPTNNYATSEINNAGTISGPLSALLSANSVYESLKEVLSQGTVKTRYPCLDHVWVVNATGGSAVTFNVLAYHTSNRVNDQFAFLYSTDNITYKSMLTVTKTTNNKTMQSFVLPSTLKGKVYIRVVNTTRTPGTTSLNTLYVDQMYIRSTP